MRPALQRIVWPVGFLTLVLALLLLVVSKPSFFVEVWALAVAGVVAIAFCRQALESAAAGPMTLPWAPDDNDRLPIVAARPRELMALERAVELGCAQNPGPHNSLRPILHETAALRLAVRRSIDLDAEPEAARAALGDRVWAIVSNTAPDAPPIPPQALADVIATLERIE